MSRVAQSFAFASIFRRVYRLVGKQRLVQSQGRERVERVLQLRFNQLRRVLRAGRRLVDVHEGGVMALRRGLEG